MVAALDPPSVSGLGCHDLGPIASGEASNYAWRGHGAAGEMAFDCPPTAMCRGPAGRQRPHVADGLLRRRQFLREMPLRTRA
jgi:hypothetical protein